MLYKAGRRSRNYDPCRYDSEARPSAPGVADMRLGVRLSFVYTARMVIK